jgi:diguanylate cyclase (GGDEF)-like protein
MGIGMAFLADDDVSGRDVERRHIRLLEAVVENFPGGLLLFDSDLKLVFCNQRQRELLDYPPEMFQDGPPSLEQIFRFNALRGEYGPGNIEEQVTQRMRLVSRHEEHVFERTRPNGVVLEIRGRPLCDGGFVTTYLDVTEQRKGQRALAFLALHDPVSDLPNRAALIESLPAYIKKLKSGEKAAVLFLDLNGFKAINDNYGHQVGDTLLRLVGSRLRRVIRETDFVCRYGGDEFVIIQSDVVDRSDIEALAKRVTHIIAEDYEINGLKVNVTVSVGVCIVPEHASAVEDIVLKADQAMYRSKRSGIAFVYADKPDAASYGKRNGENIFLAAFQ